MRTGAEPLQLDLLAWGEGQAPCPLDFEPASDVVLLTRVDAAANMRRFYRLSVARSLFGEWGVVRQWGRIGGMGRSLTEWHATPEAVQGAMAKTVGRKQQRGYR